MKQKIIRLLADLRFAIFILLLISCYSVIGTIIEQDQSIEIYKIKYPTQDPIFGFLSWNLILKFGFDHIYRTKIFILLIFLFGCSLSFCSILQQFPLLKIAKRAQFFRTTIQLDRLDFFVNLKKFSINKIISKINFKKYSLFQQKNMIYGYKGLSGRFSPIIVHFSIILILIGTIISSFFGFKAQEIVPKTDTFIIQNIILNGGGTTLPYTSVRVNDFWITYTKTRTISQFYSNISILNKKGNEIRQKTIFVNSPLIYKGIYYYQTDWNIIGLRIKTEKIKNYPILNIFNPQNKIGVTWIQSFPNSSKGLLLIIDNLEGYCSLYNNLGQFLGNLELNEKSPLQYNLILSEIIASSGIQVKSDPGIFVIYLGFFFLMISVTFSYITYSQIWVIKKNKKIFIGGTTNRALFEFEREFFSIVS